MPPPNIKNNNNDDDNVVEQKVIIPDQLSGDELEGIKKQLSDMIDVMAECHSLFAAAARYWGELPLWQKIVGGLVVTVPTLLLGVLTMIGAIITFSICSLFVYAGLGYILDNHFASTSTTTAGLKTGVFGLADLLGTVVQSLQEIKKHMGEGVETLGNHNVALGNNVTNFEGKIGEMSEQVKALEGSAEAMAEAKRQLEQASVGLQQTIAEKARVTGEQDQFLNNTRSQLDKSLKDIASKFDSFASDEKKLKAHIEQLKLVNNSFSGIVAAFNNSMGLDEAKKAEFMAKIEEMLSCKSIGLETFSNRLAEQQREIDSLTQQLASVTDDLNRALATHNEVADKNTRNADRFERLIAASTQYVGSLFGGPVPAPGVDDGKVQSMVLE